MGESENAMLDIDTPLGGMRCILTKIAQHFLDALDINGRARMRGIDLITLDLNNFVFTDPFDVGIEDDDIEGEIRRDVLNQPARDINDGNGSESADDGLNAVGVAIEASLNPCCNRLVRRHLAFLEGEGDLMVESDGGAQVGESKRCLTQFILGSPMSKPSS